jgi:hypothetical protein
VSYAAAVGPLLRCLLLVLTMLLACHSSNVPPIAEGIAVEVVLDGKSVPAIDSQRLRKHKADFRDEDRSAWKLGTLLPSIYRAEMAVSLEDPSGERRVLTESGALGQRIVVVAINRAGVLRVALVSPSNPFPPFHGRGGNRGRQGDPMRVKDVKRIVIGRASVSAATSASAAPPPRELLLEVRMETGKKVSWKRADLATVPTKAFTPSDGEGTRQAWPLAGLLAKLVGPNAVLQAVVGKRGRSVKIDPEAWADADRVPLLRLNRDGELKLLWADADMKQISGQQVRRVTALVVRGGAGD